MTLKVKETIMTVPKVKIQNPKMAHLSTAPGRHKPIGSCEPILSVTMVMMLSNTVKQRIKRFQYGSMKSKNFLL